MFKRLKGKLEEEFKTGPLKLPAAVQQLAQVISPSPSLTSLSDNNPSSSVTYTSDPSNVSTDFFSIGDDDDSQEGSSKTLPLQSIDLTATSPSNMTQSRSRRSSLSSVTSEASSLFPIYENPSGSNYFQSDLESEMEDGMPSQLEKISKEQLYQSYKKILNRYNKYKGRYVDLQRHYKDLLHDNAKTKNVLQESQDKALRRIAELKEQCQLEQNAKAHLEESLRNDVEDRDHMITTLKTKISLLRGGGGSDGLLVDVNDKDDIEGAKTRLDELQKLKMENESLHKEITDLKKLKDTACHLIHRCDTTIDEATEDVNNENLKRKMSELKGEIQKMKSENESLSHLLSKNIITEEDKRSQANSEGNLLIDLSGMDAQGDQKQDEKDKKIEKLNNLLLKCKEKISSLTAELKSKNLIIEDKNKKFKELTDEMETNKKLVVKLTADVEALKVREEENALSVAENKMAIHKELETKEEQIRALTKELKTSENEFRKEKDEIIKKYEDKLKEMTEDFAREIKYKKEENEKLNEDFNAKIESLSALRNGESNEKTNEWQAEFRKMLDSIVEEISYDTFLKSKSAEIERASAKLQERLSSVQKNMMDLIQMKQKEVESSRGKLKELMEEKDRKINELERSIAAEREGSLEKLNFEMENLNRRLQEQESAMMTLKEKNKNLLLEKEKILEEREKLKLDLKNLELLKEKIANLESEKDQVKKECEEAAVEKEKLKEELSQQNEKLETAEGNKNMLEKINNEKAEAEKKLKEYIENYKKLERENQLLETDLNHKCDKLMKDLNESKERIKSLEGEKKAKTSETEKLKEDLTKTRIEMEQNLQRLQMELQETSAAKGDISVQYENISAELNSLKKEHSDVIKEKSVIEEENARLKRELQSARGEIKDVDEMAKKLEELNVEVNKLGKVKGELSSEVKLLNEKLQNEIRVNEQFKEKLEEKKALEEEVRLLKNKNHELEENLVKIKQEFEVEKAKSLGIEENESLRKELSDVRERAEKLEREKSAENEKLKVELAESEKVKSEVVEKLKEAIQEKSMASDTLQMKLNELETLKKSLDSTKGELTARVNQLEEEKMKLVSESENKLNVLKNEIKFMNNKFEEDIGNMEESRSVEMNELNAKLEVAEKASDELLQKLERITTERDEAKVAVEERDMKISEMQNCLSSLKADMDRNFSEGQVNEGLEKHEQEMRNTVTRYETELMKREEEVQKLQKQLEEYNQLAQNYKSANEKSEENALEPGEKEVEEMIEKENRQLSTAEQDGLQLESETIESIRKKLIQQTAEMREIKKQHKREVAELRKIISVRRKSRRNSVEGPDWGGTLDNDTEHEYLRNILYEYMMGREQLVLAKVLSAIVKFDKQQTRNVLEKEQHRQTLFGQLGIL